VLLGAFAAVVTVLVVSLLYVTFSGKTVKAQVVTGEKLSEATPTANPPKPAPANPPARNILVYTGKFKSAGAGGASGTASVIRLGNGDQVLTLTDLDITNGPSLNVHLAPGNGEDMKHALKLDKLQGNKGTQQYKIPVNTDIAALHTVVIYSSLMSVPFARAEMKAQ
jgi:Electron transfer DM13